MDAGVWYRSLPRFTRYWLTATVVLSMLCRFDVIPLHWLHLDRSAVFSKLQLWRCMTSLFVFPISSNTAFHFLINCFFIVQYRWVVGQPGAAQQLVRYVKILIHNPALQLQTGEGSVQPKSGWLPVPVDRVGGAGQHRGHDLQRVLPHGHAGAGHHVYLVSAEQGRHRELLVRHQVQGHVPSLGAGRLRVHFPLVSRVSLSALSAKCYRIVIPCSSLASLVGIFVGHVYYFFKFQYSQDLGGTPLLETPQFL